MAEAPEEVKVKIKPEIDFTALSEALQDFQQALANALVEAFKPLAVWYMDNKDQLEELMKKLSEAEDEPGKE